MTQYTPEFNGLNTPDVYQLAYPSRPVPMQKPVGPAKYTVKMQKDGSAFWRVEFYDLRGGFNGGEDMDFPEGHSRVAASSNEHSFPRHMTLPLNMIAQATPDPTLTRNFIYHARIFNSLMFAMGAANGASLFKETSTTDPTVIATAYNPGGFDITCLAVVTANNVAGEQLLVGRTGGAAQLITDINGTVSGTAMDATTNLLLGAIQGFLPNLPIVLYIGGAAGGTFLTLNANVAASTAPTATGTLVPGGGSALGLLAFGNGPVRMWWLVANDNVDVTKTGRIVSTNQYGQQLQNLPFPLKHVEHAVIIRNGLAASDAERVYFNDGRQRFDMGIFENRQNNSDRYLRVGGLWPNGDELIAKVIERPVFIDGAADQWWLERYHWDLKAWSPCSAQVSTGATGTVHLNSGNGGLPISPATNNLHDYNSGDWFHKYATPEGVNPFQLRKTKGGEALGGQPYTSTGDTFTPYLEIPGLEGWPKVARRVIWGGDAVAGGSDGGTPGKVDIWLNNIHVPTFVVGHPNHTQVRRLNDNESEFYQLQVHWRLTQQVGGTDPTHYTPNGLPTIIEGIAWPEAMSIPRAKKENTV